MNGILVGAYERDNFGDLLFLTRMQAELEGVNLVCSAPTAADTRDLGGDIVVPYTEVLSNQAVDFLWFVGGEAGGTSLAAALRMAGHDRPSYLLSLPEWASPYLPRPSRFPGADAAQYIVNSAGLSGLAMLTGRRRLETLASLREATFLSVRDRSSSRVLRAEGVRHQVAPDLVHTLAIDPLAYRPERDVALVQCKASIIERIGIDEFANAISDSKQLRRYRVRLFSAGEAPGHDSREVLQRLAERISERTSRLVVEISDATTAMEKATEIANSGLWVGTSLHGFILSTSFAVPRVGLFLKKLHGYADTWQIPYPSHARLEGLDNAIESAIELIRQDDPRRKAAELAQLAAKNLASAKDQAARPGGADLTAARHANAALVDSELERVTAVGERLERHKRNWQRATRWATSSLRGPIDPSFKA